MLSERHCQMLTAYVDGELSARQRAAVEALVRQSPEARSFLDKLEGDSKELRGLPRRNAPETLPEIVMRTLTDRLPRRQPQPVTAPAAGGAVSTALGLAVAFCLLAMVTVGTFFAATGLLGDDSEQPEIAANPQPRPQPEAKKDPEPKQKDPEPEPGPIVKKYDPYLGDMLGGAAEQFSAKVEPKDHGVRVVLNEVAEEPVKKRLATELRKDAGFWLDVPARSNVKAVEQLKAAFDKSGIKVVETKAKMQPKTSYVLYVENMRPDEVARLLERLGKSESLSNPTAHVIQPITLKPITAGDRKQLANLMKVDVAKLTPPKYDPNDYFTPVEIDPPKDKGVKPPPEPERFAMLMPFNGSVANSPELKKFLETRQAMRPGTLQVVLVIHEAAA
jgi:hypothetical protein